MTTVTDVTDNTEKCQTGKPLAFMDCAEFSIYNTFTVDFYWFSQVFSITEPII